MKPSKKEFLAIGHTALPNGKIKHYPFGYEKPEPETISDARYNYLKALHSGEFEMRKLLRTAKNYLKTE